MYQQLEDAVAILDFETAAIIHDEIAYLKAEAGGKKKEDFIISNYLILHFLK